MPLQKQITKETKVELVPINSVKLWDKNPRRNDQAIEPLAKILTAHGQRSPVIVWRKNKVIYKGNTTWKALKSIGATHIKVQWEDFPSDAAAAAYAIADNKASEFSDWNDDILAQLLTAQEISVLRENTGFSEEELKGLTMEPDIGAIESLQKEDSGIKATIKIQCKPEDRDELRNLLHQWAQDCGFEGVVVK